MKILFVSSEISPYASTGGLGEVARSLPGALRRRGIDCRRIMPLYRRVQESGYQPAFTGRRLTLRVRGEIHAADVYAIEEDEVPTLFLRHDEYFGREELYSLPGGDYPDNLERFVLFQQAVVRWIEESDFHPDLVHCNDWQTALIPLYLRHGTDGAGRGGRERTVFTIHNLAYQGLFPAESFAFTGLPASCMHHEWLEFYGRMNCMKGGIVASDRVTTVSRTYAREITRPEFGFGLDGVLRTIGHRLDGIANGLDTDLWNPEKDPYIAARFDAEHLAGKDACRQDLIEHFGLSFPEDAPLYCMVSRLDEQKGFDILAHALHDLMKRTRGGLMILGTGKAMFREMCSGWRRNYPDRIGIEFGFQQDLAHRLYAGSDFLIMPSRFEPCGLNQMQAHRYGTLPIVHRTGGLAETVMDLDEGSERGDGISFSVYTSDALLGAIDRAEDLFRDRPRLDAARRRAMRADHSWGKAVESYEQLYRSLCPDAA
jgi:starch synthase